MELLSPVPFYKMPLAYENTFCGTDDSKIRNSVPASFPENPLGTGFVVKKESQREKSAKHRICQNHYTGTGYPGIQHGMAHSLELPQSGSHIGKTVIT
ncbi:MAG: DUF2169 domain-containing protein [Desulfobacteraceae bacterium]|nr:DUF2169 domain-containing protein [Desulfobacteraceae bacterium]